MRRRLRSIALEDFRDIRESGLAPPVSIIVPAYNEGVTIIESVRSLLALRYPRLELVVVNDGSSDDTLDRLIAEFGLRRTPRVYWQRIKSKPVRGIYWSPAYPGLWVLDKVNGRKADAVNAGINLASAPYVCVIDGDSVLESDAMAAIMHAVAAAVGGDRRGRRHRPDRERLRGRAAAPASPSVGVPRTWLGAAQVIEYLRAFLFGRAAWSELGSLMIVSGAFGVFRKDVLVEIGGFRHDTVGEDMDLVVRMHRHMRAAGRPYRVAFVPDPVCWTECPETLADLRRQRERWQRGLGETLDHSHEMLASPAVRADRPRGHAVPHGGRVPGAAARGDGVRDPAGGLGAGPAEAARCSCCSSRPAWSTGSASRSRRCCWRSSRSGGTGSRGTCCGSPGAAVVESVVLRQLHSWWRLVALLTWRGRPQVWHSAPRQGFSVSPPVSP